MMCLFLCFFFSVYENGACFSPEVLDITSEDLLKHFVEVCNIESESCISCNY